MPNWIAMLLLDKKVVLILLSLRLYLLRSNPKKKRKIFQTMNAMNGNFKLHKQQP